MNEDSFDQDVFIHIGSRHRNIDAVTIFVTPSDFAQSDSEISYPVLTINPVALPSVYTWISNQKVLDQDMTMLVPMSQLKRSGGIGIDRAEIETFSIGAFNAKIAKD